MRIFAEIATDPVRKMLTRLTERPGHEEYRSLVICTNEDADFLATGMLRSLERLGCTHISLACFWNERKRIGPTLDVAPIVRQYIEPVEGIDVFVVVKSIISSACVVRTNISELVYGYQPKQIIVIAPVILAGSTESLEAEFDPSIAAKFDYVWFAQDNDKEDGRRSNSRHRRKRLRASRNRNQFIEEQLRA